MRIMLPTSGKCPEDEMRFCVYNNKNYEMTYKGKSTVTAAGDTNFINPLVLFY